MTIEHMCSAQKTTWRAVVHVQRDVSVIVCMCVTVCVCVCVSAQAQQCTAEGLMSRIQVMRAKDAAQQLACLQLLPEYLTAHPQVRTNTTDTQTHTYTL